ncbi:Otoferlin [Araneus ventricosus]|uniref:Otoferlin n=1 Tax=Araneus ventricosus TaxID=182803 RepID=A0A4Y2PYL8_ARAVE|nr:Otoferlin [Araneus ventricosus]
MSQDVINKGKSEQAQTYKFGVSDHKNSSNNAKRFVPRITQNKTSKFETKQKPKSIEKKIIIKPSPLKTKHMNPLKKNCTLIVWFKENTNGNHHKKQSDYFPLLKNRPERIVLRQPREKHPEKGRKRPEGNACGHSLHFSIQSIILARLIFKQLLQENVRVAVDTGMRTCRGHCISNLQKPVNSVGSRDEVFGDSLLKDLEKMTKCYLKILKEFSDLYSSRTQLDQERSRMYERDLEEVLKVSAAARAALNKNMLEGTIDKLNHLRTKMESLADDPQSGVPDVIVWLESGSKRVGHARVCARELLYAVREYERGEQSGKTITLFLKCLGRRGDDTLLAKVECYLWLGVAKQMDYCFRDLPQGFSVEYGFEALDDTERMPKTLHYLGKFCHLSTNFRCY